MLLKNKKTGEIIDIYKGEITLHHDQGRKTIHFKRLEDLEEWEDVPEEPKVFWFIKSDGNIGAMTEDSPYYKHLLLGKELGNYFETKEEAEKAVEKLKAWKRLKDKNFHFLKYSALGCGEIEFSLDFEDIDDEGEIGELQHDLDLLFCMEEKNE